MNWIDLLGLQGGLYGEGQDMTIDNMGVDDVVKRPDWTDPNSGRSCSSYACNSPESDPIGDQLRKAGADEDGQVTCEEVVKAALAAGLKKPDEKDCCPEGYHKVNLRTGDGNIGENDGKGRKENDHLRDYHAYRQNSDGNWSHLSAASNWPGGELPTPMINPENGKPSGVTDTHLQISAVDADGKPLTGDLSKNNHNYENYDYGEDCGTFCSKTKN